MYQQCFRKWKTETCHIRRHETKNISTEYRGRKEGSYYCKFMINGNHNKLMVKAMCDIASDRAKKLGQQP